MNPEYMATVVLTLLGFGLSFWVGMGKLHHSALDVIWAIIAAQLASGIALPVTLYFQRSPKLRFLTRGPLKSWIMLLTLTLGLLMLFCPWLRDLGQLAWMFFPLFLAIAVMVAIYGPIQDQVLRKATLRKRA